MDELFDDDIDIFICDLDDSEYLNPKRTQNMNHQNEENLKTHRTRKESSDQSKYSKNKQYVEKIKEFGPKSDMSSLMKIEEGAQFNQPQKKERNRLAAKQSRNRKKMYIQLMEHEHKKLEEDLNKVDAQLEETKKNIARFVSQNKILTGFNTLSQLQSKFEKILRHKNNQDVDIQINTMLDSMRYRQGATGKQRVRKINDSFKQIINLSLPPVLRYFVWASSQKKHFFAPQADEIDKDEFYQQILHFYPEIEGKKQKYSELREPIVSKKNELFELLEHLKTIRGSLKKKCNEVEEEIDDIREILTPTQCLQLLIFINKKRYRKQINFLSIEQNQIDQQSLPRKRVKTDE